MTFFDCFGRFGVVSFVVRYGKFTQTTRQQIMGVLLHTPGRCSCPRSTGKIKRNAAMEICLQWAASAIQARRGNFTEAQARKVVNDIAQRSGMGAVEFTTTQQFLTDWITSKEITKAKGTTVRIASSLKPS